MQRSIAWLLPLCGGGIAAAAGGQVDWLRAAPPMEPSARCCTEMTFDAARGRAVIFGGFDPLRGFLAETWEWDGSAWTLPSTAGPSARDSHGLVYDAALGATVLFGGGRDGAPFGDTWTWDGSTWRQLGGVGPPGRRAFAMAYDSSRGEVVLFGGAASGLLGDTWVLRSGQWMARAPSGAPSPRAGCVMAYDAWRDRVVLFGGGRVLSRSYLGDTWEWDGTDWTQRSPANAPSPRGRHAMAWDAARGRVVLFGGEDDSVRYADVWEWDGTDWQQRVPSRSPPARRTHAVAYDSWREQVVMFGGVSSAGFFGDTWVYAPLTPAQHQTFGTGCVGSAGVVSLVPDPRARPWIGDTFRVRVAGAPVSGLSVMSIGSSTTSWRGLVLPADLGALLGMRSCTLYTGLDLVLPLVRSQGVPTLAVAVPNAAGLVGAQLHNQAFTADPAANPAGVTASDGGTARIGAR